MQCHPQATTSLFTTLDILLAIETALDSGP
jgi:hypothetical protein